MHDKPHYAQVHCSDRSDATQVISIDVGHLIAGTSGRGEFEERLKNLIDEVKQQKDVLLFIDEVHTLIGLGGAGAIDASNILKPALARGELQVILLPHALDSLMWPHLC